MKIQKQVFLNKNEIRSIKSNKGKEQEEEEEEEEEEEGEEEKAGLLALS